MEDWRSKALCFGAPTDWWFPSDRVGNPYKQAEKICMKCPVREECLLEALIEEEGLGRQSRLGMRGGLRPHQRARLARKIKAERLALEKEQHESTNRSNIRFEAS